MSTPEMNHIEQIGKQIRPMGFKNGLFHWLSDVVNRICQTINKLEFKGKKLSDNNIFNHWIIHYLS